MNLRDWIVKYYTVYRAMELKLSTIRSYLSYLPNVPSDWELETITAEDLQLLINNLARRLSASSVKHTYSIISEPIKNAPRFGFCDRSDIFMYIKLPKLHKKIVHSLSDAELDKLLPFIFTSAYADVYLTLLNMGMRFCELSGLNTSDFSESDMVVKIQQRFYRGELENGSKTTAGVRVLPIPTSLQEIFLKHSSGKSSEKPIFLSVNGFRMSYNTILHNWHKICDSAGVRRCGIHTLRHTFATKLLDAGASLKVVSAFLGHKSIAITADIYCDVPMSAKRNAIALYEFAQTKNHSE